MQLKDSVIIITGGGQGLGRSMGEFLAAKGAKLALVDLNQEALDAAVAACKAAGGDARSYICNVANEEQVIHMVSQVAEDFGAIHGLINNAGISTAGPVEIQDMEATKLLFDTNVFGPQRMMRAVLPAMRAAKSGQIFNITSQLGRVIVIGCRHVCGELKKDRCASVAGFDGIADWQKSTLRHHFVVFFSRVARSFAFGQLV